MSDQGSPATPRTEAAGHALALALADSGYVDPHPYDQYALIETLPILAALDSRGFAVVPKSAAREDAAAPGLREALEIELRKQNGLPPLMTSEGYKSGLMFALRALAAAPAAAADARPELPLPDLLELARQRLIDERNRLHEIGEHDPESLCLNAANALIGPIESLRALVAPVTADTPEATE